MKRFAWISRAFLLSAVLAIGVPVLAADATLNQVYEAVHAGRLSQAQAMMSEVLRDHPDSAKAHYVEAEILAKEGHASEARGELSRAEQLAPGLPFVSQASVQELRSVIASEGARQVPFVSGVQSATAPAAHGSTFPWALVLIVVVGGFVIYSIIRARRNAAVVPYSSGGAGVPGAGVPSYGAPPMAPMGGGMGSGIVGGLVTGAAVGAGVVAGEALAHELIGGHGSAGDVRRVDDAAPLSGNDVGGQDFGISDAGSWDDGGAGFGGGGGDDWS